RGGGAAGIHLPARDEPAVRHPPRPAVRRGDGGAGGCGDHAGARNGEVAAAPARPVRRTAAGGEMNAPAAATGELVLALNCGSSSIKFALFDASAQPLP